MDFAWEHTYATHGRPRLCNVAQATFLHKLRFALESKTQFKT